MAAKSFSGGAKLEAKLKEIAAMASRAGVLRVGFLEGATYPDGTSVATVAAIQEFGAPAAGIPSRPFFRNMIAEKSPEWGASLGRVAVSTGYDMDKTLALMGEGIGSQLQRSILEFEGEPLAPATIAAKGFDKQLIDTGHMVNSVGYQVDREAKVTLPAIATPKGKA